MMRNPVLVALILLTGTMCTEIEALRFGETRQTTVVETAAHASFPSVTGLVTGDLLCVFREGTGPVSHDGRVCLCRSTDGGKTWSPPDTVIAAMRDCRDPSIVQLVDGTVLLSFYESERRGERREAVGCFVARSFDQGHTFTAPRMMPLGELEWAATSDAIVEMDNGVLAFPMYGGARNGASGAWVAFSEDGGGTWSDPLRIAGDPEGTAGFYEPALIQLPDSKLLCTMGAGDMRTKLFRCVSDDHGETWSDPRQINVQGGAADLVLTEHGTLLCAYRDSWPAGISVMRSYDWGETWERETQLYGTQEDSARPSMTVAGGGVLAVYDEGHGLPEARSIQAALFHVRPPGTPEGLAVSSREGRVILRWNRVEDASYYIVYRDTVAPSPQETGRRPVPAASVVTNSFTDLPPPASRDLYYRVSAAAGSGELLPGTGNESPPTEAVAVRVEE